MGGAVVSISCTPLHCVHITRRLLSMRVTVDEQGKFTCLVYRSRINKWCQLNQQLVRLCEVPFEDFTRLAAVLLVVAPEMETSLRLVQWLA